MSEYDIFDAAAGKPRLCSQMCDTCILRPGSVVTAALPAGRVRDLIADARRGESFVVCHSTFGEEAAVCRGFADAYSTNALRVMGRLTGFLEVAPPSKAVTP